jgi:hypothetical protein
MLKASVDHNSVDNVVSCFELLDLGDPNFQHDLLI